MKKVPLLIFFGLILCLNHGFAQPNVKGKIIYPSVPELSVLDPNGDGYVSKPKDPPGFSSLSYNVPEFEIRMFGIPKLGGDAENDNIGQPCGVTDLIPDDFGYSVYGALDNNNNLIFRFRVGSNNPSVEAYTILLDTDGLFGADDPNATTDNPGFEIDITLIKRDNAGVFIYDIDGISSCPQPVKNYPFNGHFQISIADKVTCGDPDYFYDFYIPFADLAALGVTANSPVRFVAVDNVSATCAMSGKIGDISGVDYDDYKGCVPCAFKDLVQNQCPTSIADLCETCEGFGTGITPEPKIFKPVKAGETIVKGSSIPNALIFIEVYNDAGVLRESIETQADEDGLWVGTLGPSLLLNDKIVVKAKSPEPGSCESGGATGDAIAFVVSNEKPVLTGTPDLLIYIENDGAVAIEPGILVTDADDENLAGATVSIITNYVNGEDVLGFQNQSGITGTFDPATGILTLTGNASVAAYQTALQSVTYTNNSENPNILTRTVQFIVSDALDASDPYTRDIQIERVNDAPEAADDVFFTNEDTPLNESVATNDSDVDGLGATYSKVSDPSNGSLTFNSNGTFTYTPNANYNGTDQFEYILCDGGTPSLCANATVIITVIAVNDAPEAADDVFSTNEDTALNESVATNDSDVDGPGATYSKVSDPSNGSLTFNSNGTFTYTPNANYNGTDQFEYILCDGGIPDLCDNATVTISINAVNDPPVITGSGNPTSYIVGGVIIDNMLQVTDIDNTTLVGGTITISNNFINGDELIFSDQNGITGSYNSITGVLTLTGGTSLAHYSAAIASIKFLNDTGDSDLTRRITFVANDGIDESLPYHVFIDFDGNQAGPVLVDNLFETDEDIPLEACLNVTDLDGDDVKIDSFSEATGNGIFTLNGGVCFTFIPTLNFFGIETAKVTLCDVAVPSICEVYTITINVWPVNDPPEAVNDIETTNEDVPVTFNILANDTDVDSAIDPATVDLNPNTPHVEEKSFIVIGEGTYEVDDLGNVTFTPALNYNGAATPIKYTVKDVEGAASNEATIMITVSPENDAPVANHQPVTVIEDTPKDILLTGSDEEGSTLTFTIVTLPVHGTLSGSGANVTYSPDENYNGPDAFTFQVSDGMEYSNVATVSINVIPDNDAPEAEDQPVAAEEDKPKVITLIASDIDGDELEYFIVSPPLHGTVSISGTGPNVTYTPHLNYNGPDSFTFKVHDGTVDSNIATVSIDVSPVNDKPVISPVPVLSTPEDTELLVCLGVSDVEGDMITFNPANNISGGGTMVPSNEFNFCYIFAPALNYNGQSIWDMEVCDNGSPVLCEGVRVTINVTPVNDPPVAERDLFAGDNTITVNGNVLLNDWDLENNNLIVTTTLISLPLYGQATIAANGDIQFTAPQGFIGRDSVVYQVCDDGPAECGPGGNSPCCSTAVVVFDITPPELKVYEAVSANGDGLNDYWRIEGIEDEKYKNNMVRVFDRYNNLVFEQRNYNNEDKAWRGQTNHGVSKSDLPEGTYFYSIEFSNGRLLRGFVVLRK